ncbi:MAG: PKD domain-containing protein [Bacteroides helcogenes]|uniref:PKD domain-containing protein n=2 Tax=Bacteroides helcogenes TaxID=290053 RepID=E6SMZ7_BACT6|nr:PKD domain-containing protein [Bacteroides helcogenes]ADV43666.1 hypothetical protein Bache_1666 [Bacteroides helcogenes P 36-108]MDY5239388.1 PKD domain-containing protein [Bacteroides helcogenes]
MKLEIMKKSYLNILWALVFPFMLGSCSEEDYSDADINNISTLDGMENAVSVSVDQATNVVTFTVDESTLKGNYPAWTFGTGATDAATSSTKSTLTKAYSKRGDYTVTFQLGNKNGLSKGVITKTFHIEKNLIPSAIISSLTKETLYWNFMANGHFGCGESNPSLENYGLDWWSCAANGKGDTGMYDDTFTFKTEQTSGTLIEGTYEYNPGIDGLIYVNAGVTFEPFGAFNPNDGNDYDAKASKQTSTWKLYYDDADVLWLEFAPKTQVGFVANEGVWNTPKFRVLELTDKKIAMVADNGSIAWKYVFCPKDQNEVDDIGAEKYADAIVGSWMWNYTVDGHFGCGETVDNPLGWWSCGSKGKDGFGMYDDKMTFTEDSYTFDPGEEGTIFCNKGCTYDPTLTNDKDDYVAKVKDGEVLKTTYQIVVEGGNHYLVLPAKTIFSYMPADEVYDSPKFLIKRISKDKSIMELASIQSGISWLYQLKRTDK